MVAHHGEQDRQREVVVVHAALLAAPARLGIGRATGADRVDHAPLSRDDHEEHVPHHDRPDDRPDLHICGACAEHRLKRECRATSIR